MGLEPELRARYTGEKGSTFTDKHNKVYAKFDVGYGPTNDTEILRGEFAKMMYEVTYPETEWRFGDCVTSVEEQIENGKVRVGFESGKQEDFDYFIIAEGARSRSRKIVFGENAFEYKPVNECKPSFLCQLAPRADRRVACADIAYFSIPLDNSIPHYDDWHIIPLPNKRMIYFRPDFKANLSRAGIMFMSPTSKGYEKLSSDDQKRLIAEIFADGGESAERMIAGLWDSKDLYFEYLGQVHAPSWSTESGRIHMVGDTAYCGTPNVSANLRLMPHGADRIHKRSVGWALLWV